MASDSQAADQQQLSRSFRWRVPARFNIADDVCGRWAADRGRFALYYEDASGFSSAHTFWDIQREANRLSNVLAALATVAGDRVAVVLPQRPEAAIAQVSILQMGAIAVPLAPRLGPDALAHRLRDSGAHLAIVDETAWPSLEQVRHRLPALRHVIGIGAAVGRAVRPWAAVVEHASPRYTPTNTAAGDPALILYPDVPARGAQGVLLAQRALLGNVGAYASAHECFPQDADLFWSPLDWACTGGLLQGLLATWHFGRPLLAYNGPFDAGKAFALLQHYAVRNCLLEPSALQMLQQTLPDPRASCDLDLRTLASSGQPLGEAIRNWSQDKLGVTISEIWCGTGISGVVGPCAARSPTSPGSLGRPYPGHRVAVLDHRGAVLGAGVVGALAVHRLCNDEEDPAVPLGFWQGPAATDARLLADGWFRTGALAEADAQGNFWYRGRARDV
ncbi:MAG: Acetyl-coenzyme A synthetase [Candidatus Accumulibacter adjunctus]|uniref:Acetyl-coenzyme A synthetase n=1 Tax=Candidatus Accumulibacter adjunctus TaxID=1454001 RepID=A0A011PSS0_9PROT|nr:MAG: Acetyl-coenzyme A synthetase [Candidatus Accumulibacter adjunctus]